MTVLPLPDPNPEDPAEILRALPADHIDTFLAEYAEALDLARDPEKYPALRAMLHLWRLHAFATQQPGYAEREAAAREAARTGDWGDCIPLEDAIAAHQRR